MSFSFWASELLRESRFWFSPATCPGTPWGAIALCILLAFCFGCILGSICTLVVVSPRCRASVWVVLRLLVSNFEGPAGPAVGTRLQTRFGEYQRGH